MERPAVRVEHGDVLGGEADVVPHERQLLEVVADVDGDRHRRVRDGGGRLLLEDRHRDVLGLAADVRCREFLEHHRRG